jgi:hypothetical protein
MAGFVVHDSKQIQIRGLQANTNPWIRETNPLVHDSRNLNDFSSFRHKNLLNRQGNKMFHLQEALFYGKQEVSPNFYLLKKIST